MELEFGARWRIQNCVFQEDLEVNRLRTIHSGCERGREVVCVPQNGEPAYANFDLVEYVPSCEIPIVHRIRK